VCVQETVVAYSVAVCQHLLGYMALFGNYRNHPTE